VNQEQTLSVVVPAYNEGATLRAAVDGLLKAMLPLALEVVVVDDGSTDDNNTTIDDLVHSGRIRTVRHEVNQGTAVRSGIAEATGDLLTILDADLEYNPADYVISCVPSWWEATVVYGTRSFGTTYSFWYGISNRFLSLWTGLLYDRWVADIRTPFKVAHTDVWRSLDLRSVGFGIEAELTGKIRKSGLCIHEVPITYKARTRQEGKKSRSSDGLRALWILLRIRLFGQVRESASLRVG